MCVRHTHTKMGLGLGVGLSVGLGLGLGLGLSFGMGLGLGLGVRAIHQVYENCYRNHGKLTGASKSPELQPRAVGTRSTGAPASQTGAMPA